MKQTIDKTLQKTTVVCLLALVCCLFWGSAFPSVKIGYSLFHIAAGDSSSQILFAGYRFTLAGVLIIGIGSIIQKRFLLPQKKSWGKVSVLGLIQTVIQYVFFYIGIAHTTGVKSSIIVAANVFIAVIVSSLLFKLEKLTLRKMLGCIVGFAGVVLINVPGNSIDVSFSFKGEGFLLLSTVAYAFSSVLIKKFSKDEEPMTLAGYQFLIGGIVMIAIGLIAGGSVRGFTLVSSLMLLYLAIISAVAYSIWGILLKYNPVSKVAVFGFMNPVFGVILSALLLGEGEQAFSLLGLVSLILACLGIYITNREPKRKRGETFEN
jgi:drug/metabolite transporter (DMT)-like permease